MHRHHRRQNILRALGERQPKLDALIITHPANIQYLCGFTGSAGVLLAHPARWTLFTDGRYAEQARKQTADIENIRVVISRGKLLVAAAAALAKNPYSTHRKIQRIGFEADYLTVAGRNLLSEHLPKRAPLHSTSGMVESFRMIKDAEEIHCLRAAAQLGSDLLQSALASIRPGVSELAVAAGLEWDAKTLGAPAMAFETIVASGPRSALPHARASAEAIPENGFVVLDFGVMLRYCSDMTRTTHVGRPSGPMRELYQAVLEAQQAAIDAIRPGVQAGDIDRIARGVLRRRGWAKYFTHSTGHGVGLEVHEPPRLGRNSTDRLQTGMVITIEPGVYLPGKGGVRIEDMALVTERGAEVLTLAPKELVIL